MKYYYTDLLILDFWTQFSIDEIANIRVNVQLSIRITERIYVYFLLEISYKTRVYADNLVPNQMKLWH